MPLPPFTLPGRRSRAQELYEVLSQAILEGTLQPNERLVEEAIAEMASVSRTPVREALRKLEADGLVRATHAGIVVAGQSLEELSDLCAVRETLEGMASRLAATHRSDLTLSTLRHILAETREAYQQGDVRRMVHLNHAFHDCIWQAARHRYLAQQLNLLRRLIERLQHSTLHRRERQKEMLAEHQAILDAIAEGDAAEAERRTRDHFRKAMAIRLSNLAALADRQEASRM
ncbi:MAG TPA: GntR family transcriptional regulator [Bacillota bacterium]